MRLCWLLLASLCTYNWAKFLNVREYHSEQDLFETVFDRGGLSETQHVFLGLYDGSVERCRRPLEERFFTLGTYLPAPELVHVGKLDVATTRTPTLADLTRFRFQVLCVEVLYFPLGEPIESWSNFDTDELSLQEYYIAWVREQLKPEITFTNTHTEPIDVYQLQEFEKEHKFHFKLQPGESLVRHSPRIGDIVLTKTPDMAGDEIGDWQLVSSKTVRLGKESAQECESQEGQEICVDAQTAMSRRARSHWFSQQLLFNRIQPTLIPALTRHGFEINAVPKEIFASIKKIWEDSRDSLTKDVHHDSISNRHMVPTYTTNLAVEADIVAQLQPYVERWAHTAVSHVHTSGITVYSNRSIEMMHLCHRHIAVTMMINVDEDLDENWLFHVIGHSGKVHKVAVQPGEFIVYESSKLLYGRPLPLSGRFQANLFTTWKPVNWHLTPEWVENGMLHSDREVLVHAPN